MSDVLLSGVSKDYGAVNVIPSIDLHIKAGELVVFVGPSGCGKSTLLRMIAGLEHVTRGDISIGGTRVNDVAASSRGIAMVFQSYALYPHMTVYQNMAFGLELARTPKAEIEKQVRDAARILQIEPLLDRRPKALSGGQRQRVAIGRAIVRNPKVFLFDEPLSNLDASLRGQTRVEIAHLHHSLGATMIYVTHDQTEAMTLADRIVVLNKGNIEQVGTPLELYGKPVNTFVAGFIANQPMNMLDVVAENRGGKIVLKLDGGAEIEAETPMAERARTLGIRPEDVVLVDSGKGPLTGTVSVVEHLGENALIHMTLTGGQEFIVKVDGAPDLAIGAEVSVALVPGRAHVFDANGHALREGDTQVA